MNGQTAGHAKRHAHWRGARQTVRVYARSHIDRPIYRQLRKTRANARPGMLPDYYTRSNYLDCFTSVAALIAFRARPSDAFTHYLCIAIPNDCTYELVDPIMCAGVRVLRLVDRDARALV